MTTGQFVIEVRNAITSARYDPEYSPHDDDGTPGELSSLLDAVRYVVHQRDLALADLDAADRPPSVPPPSLP